MNEKVFRYGENSRGIGVLTLPDDPDRAPVVVLLNAGLLHRTEPYRLNVMVGRQMAKAGYIALRVDLSGKGDTPARENLTNRESVALDWRHIKVALKQQFGDRCYIIFGLCSGADNGIKLAADDIEVRGLVLLDAVSPPDRGFWQRAILKKLTSKSRWLNLPRIHWRRVASELWLNGLMLTSETNLRDMPRSDDLQRCFENLVRLEGRVLAVFTSHASEHYNETGQFSRAVGVHGLPGICEEHYWPAVSHLYPIWAHRNRLVACVDRWAQDNLERFRGGR